MASSLSERILTLIRDEKAHNRADLARVLKRAPSTISVHVNALIANGQLREEGETSSTGGRPGRRLIATQTHAYFLVADIGTESLRYSIADNQGNLLSPRHTPLNHTQSANEQFTTLTTAFHELITEHPTTPLHGICIGMPAPIDHQRGCVQSSARIPQWNDFPIVTRLQEEFNLPTLLENDVNLLALAEHHQNTTHADSITLKAGKGTGIGIIIDGKVHRGATGAAGDISHVRHNNYGEIRCACGNIGCLATVVSIDALTHTWTQTGEGTTFDSLFEAAQNSNPHATHIFRQAGEHLGTALCTVVSFFNPGAVYLSGPLAQIDVYVSAIRTAIYGGCHPLITRELTIEHSQLDINSELHGAAILAQTLVQ